MQINPTNHTYLFESPIVPISKISILCHPVRVLTGFFYTFFYHYFKINLTKRLSNNRGSCLKHYLIPTKRRVLGPYNSLIKRVLMSKIYLIYQRFEFQGETKCNPEGFRLLNFSNIGIFRGRKDYFMFMIFQGFMV